MAVTAVVGEPGTGKTYYAVHKTLDRWARDYKRAKKLWVGIYGDRGWLKNMPPAETYRGLAANFDFDRSAVRYYLVVRHGLDARESSILAQNIQTIKTIQGLLDLWNAFVIFDEAQLWFNARDFAYFPTEVLSAWTQHRKAGLDIILCTQHISMIDSNIRGVTSWTWRARPLPFIARLFFKLIGDDRPRFRYVATQTDFSGQQRSEKVRYADSFDRMDGITFDPVVARCYATTGFFYSPASEIHEAANSTKRKIAEKLGLTYDLTKFRKNVKGRKSADEPISWEAYTNALIEGDSAAVAAAVAEHDQQTEAKRAAIDFDVLDYNSKNPAMQGGAAGNRFGADSSISLDTSVPDVKFSAPKEWSRI